MNAVRRSCVKNKGNKKFSYNISMEYAFATVLGESVHGNAGLYDNPTYIKKDFKKWINIIEKRIYELTEYDERLLTVATSHLNRIKDKLKQISTDDVEWDIITHMIWLVGHLLGYDFFGEINHHVIFYQDRYQIDHTERMMTGRRIVDDYEWCYHHVRNYQADIVRSLKEKGLTNYQVSQIMNISEYKVKKFLKMDSNNTEAGV